MKPTASSINTCRGPVIDEAALIEALRTAPSPAPASMSSTASRCQRDSPLTPARQRDPHAAHRRRHRRRPREADARRARQRRALSPAANRCSIALFSRLAIKLVASVADSRLWVSQLAPFPLTKGLTPCSTRRSSTALVVTADGHSRLDVGVSGGQVALLAAPGSLPTRRKTIDAAGLLVLPGVDRLALPLPRPRHPRARGLWQRHPGRRGRRRHHRLEMPISMPPDPDGATLAARRAHAERDAYVDVGFYTSSATLDRDKIQSGVDEGALAFKAFLQEVPPGREEEFDGLCIHRNDEILRALELVAQTGLPAVFHAEDYETYTYLERAAARCRPQGPAAHWEWRPDYVEAISISTLMLLGGGHRRPRPPAPRLLGLAVCLIRDAKRRGAPVTAETCPQYLSFNRATLEEHGPFAKCNPPLKTEADNAGPLGRPPRWHHRYRRHRPLPLYRPARRNRLGRHLARPARIPRRRNPDPLHD